jgi:hypothetical protein
MGHYRRRYVRNGAEKRSIWAEIGIVIAISGVAVGLCFLVLIFSIGQQ